VPHGGVVAVTGAAGAVGGYATELAKADGLTVIADVSWSRPADRSIQVHPVMVADGITDTAGLDRLRRQVEDGAEPTACWRRAAFVGGWCSTSPDGGRASDVEATVDVPRRTGDEPGLWQREIGDSAGDVARLTVVT
jgi:hypothetical protein